MPPPACRPGCASRTAASPCARARVPIVPAAILFDLLNGGDKNWGRYPPYRELGYAAAASGRVSTLRWAASAPALGATTVDCKGGLGSASAQSADGHTVGALAAVNAAGSVAGRRRTMVLGGAVRARRRIRRTRASSGVLCRGARAAAPRAARARARTLVVVATDAVLTKAQAKRLAVMAQTGLARAIYPVHTPLDGDVVFAARPGAGRSPIRSSG